jgi:hypothetical protein
MSQREIVEVYVEEKKSCGEEVLMGKAKISSHYASLCL